MTTEMVLLLHRLHLQFESAHLLGISFVPEVTGADPSTFEIACDLHPAPSAYPLQSHTWYPALNLTSDEVDALWSQALQEKLEFALDVVQYRWSFQRHGRCFSRPCITPKLIQ